MSDNGRSHHSGFLSVSTSFRDPNERTSSTSFHFPLWDLSFPVLLHPQRQTSCLKLLSHSEALLWQILRETKSYVKFGRNYLLNCECLVNIHWWKKERTKERNRLAFDFSLCDLTGWFPQQTFLECNKALDTPSHFTTLPCTRGLVWRKRKPSLTGTSELLAVDMGSDRHGPRHRHGQSPSRNQLGPSATQLQAGEGPCDAHCLHQPLWCFSFSHPILPSMFGFPQLLRKVT